MPRHASAGQEVAARCGAKAGQRMAALLYWAALWGPRGGPPAAQLKEYVRGARAITCGASGRLGA